MKQQYINKEFLNRVMVKVKEHKRDFKFIPDNSALVIVDMQKYFTSTTSKAYIPGTKNIIPGINKLVKNFLINGLPVIFTRHVNSKEDAKLLLKWWDELIIESPLSELTEDLDSSKSTVIKKTQYDAFYKTELESILLKNDVKRLVICGVMTNLCCETTARSGFARGFEIFFTIDGTATQNEDFHMATILNLTYGFATPVLIEEILSLTGFPTKL